MTADLGRQLEQARSIAVALEQENAELQRRINAALALHRPTPLGQRCCECDLQWPCTTRQALAAAPACPEPPTSDGD